MFATAAKHCPMVYLTTKVEMSNRHTTTDLPDTVTPHPIQEQKPNIQDVPSENKPSKLDQVYTKNISQVVNSNVEATFLRKSKRSTKKPRRYMNREELKAADSTKEEHQLSFSLSQHRKIRNRGLRSIDNSRANSLKRDTVTLKQLIIKECANWGFSDGDILD